VLFALGETSLKAKDNKNLFNINNLWKKNQQISPIIYWKNC